MATMPLPAFVEWNYMPDGKVLHALGHNAHGHASEAKCGVWSPAWYGTGSQDEYERAATSPPCKRCLRVLRIKESS